MIRIEVGLALRISDGYTGRTVDGNTLLFTIDGVRKKAVTKEGGYCVFTGLSSGSHTVQIESVLYCPEEFSFETGSGIIPVVLKPGKNYRYSPQSTYFLIENKEKEKNEIWVGRILPDLEIKIAQSDLGKGDSELRLYTNGQGSELSLPGIMLILDGKNTEPVVLMEFLEEEKSPLSSSLCSNHKRGCQLVPAQRYEIEQGEDAEIRFPEGTKCAFWFSASKQLILPETCQGNLTIGGEE